MNLVNRLFLGFLLFLVLANSSEARSNSTRDNGTVQQVKKYLENKLSKALLSTARIRRSNASTCYDLATTCFVNGSRANACTYGAVIKYGYDARGDRFSDGDPATTAASTYIATIGQIGSVWGTAYDKYNNNLYVAAFIRRHSDLGAGGVGAIYQIDLDAPPAINMPACTALTPWLDINNIPCLGTGATLFPADPGAASRGLGASNMPNQDTWAFDKVAKQGIADIELSADGTTMYVVDMTNQQVLIVDMATQACTQVPITSPCTGTSNFRPFAVSEHNGEIFIGVVCDGTGGTPDISHHVVQFNSTNTGTVVTATWTTTQWGPSPFNDWRFWSDDYNDFSEFDANGGTPPLDIYANHYQSLLTDIEFANNGDMVIGMTSRDGFQLGWNNYPPNTTSYLVKGLGYGDVQYATENAGTYTPNQANSQWTFYETADFTEFTEETEEGVFIGGLVLSDCCGTEYVTAQLQDPNFFESNGAVWMEQATGQTQGNNIDTGRLELVFVGGGAPDNFGKAIGLGDLEMLIPDCDLNITTAFATNCSGTNPYTADWNISINTVEAPDNAISYQRNSDAVQNQTLTGTGTLVLNNIPADGGSYDTLKVWFTNQSTCADTLIIKRPSPCPPNLGSEAGEICNSTANEIAGTVFEDWNYDGIMNQQDTIGVQGVQVIATDCSGASQTTYTDPNGNYEFTGLTDTDYRIEFVLPQSVSCWAYPTHVGTDNGTMVQFVSTGNCANLGLASPSDYCQDNPLVALACYVNGTADGGGTNEGFVSLAYSASGNSPTIYKDVEVQDIGSVWGAAYQGSSQTLFTASFLKRHVGFDNSPGAIFLLDYSTTPATLASFSDLENTVPANVGDALSGGANIHLGTVDRSSGADYTLSTAPNLSNIDLDAFAKIATMSYGDLDLSEDHNTLWTVNLFQKALISIDVSNGTIGTTNQYLIELMDGLPNCQNGVLRPFGLDFHKGRGYLGVVCDASFSQNNTDLEGYVLSFDPAQLASGFTTEITLDFEDYRSDHTFVDMQAWVSTWAQTGFNTTDGSQNGTRHMHMQPIISDISFDETGSMIIGVMDRMGHQVGFVQDFAVAGGGDGAYEDGRARGTIIRACKIGDEFVIENNTSCGNNFFDLTGFNDGANGTYYVLKAGDGSPSAFAGGFLSLQGQGELITPIADPYEPGTESSLPNPSTFFTHGLHWLKHADGAHDDWTVLVPQGTAGQTSKANGLGDPEAICQVAPLEIGNYVWEDTNENGIQDACEAGIQNILIELYDDNCSLIATTTTDANGNYYFSKDGAPNQIWTTTDDSLVVNSNYYLVLGNGQYASNILTVNGMIYQLTTTDAGSNDRIDSDGTEGVACGALANLPFQQVMMNRAGMNSHQIDFGFRICPMPDATIVAYQASCTGDNANSDASLSLTAFSNADRINYSIGASYTGDTDYANATPIGTLPFDIATGLSNPNGSQDYTIRVFNGLSVCFTDYTITVYGNPCTSCTNPMPYGLCWDQSGFVEPPNDDASTFPYTNTMTNISGSGIDLTVTLFQPSRDSGSDPDPQQSYVSPGSRCGCTFDDEFGSYLSCGEVFRNWSRSDATPDTIIMSFSEPIHLPVWGFGGFRGSSNGAQAAVAGFTFYDGPNATGNKVVSSLPNPGGIALINTGDPLAAAINQLQDEGPQETELYNSTYFYESNDNSQRGWTILDMGDALIHSIMFTQFTVQSGLSPEDYVPIPPTSQNNSGYVSSFDFNTCNSDDCTTTTCLPVQVEKNTNN